MQCEELLAARKLPKIWENGGCDWESRREEIVELLQREVYGFRPKEPEEIAFMEMQMHDVRFDENFCAGKASVKRVEINVKLNGQGFMFPVCAVIPKGEQKHPFFVMLNFWDNVPDIYLPTEELVDNGFAVFSFCYKDVTSDDADFGNGLAGVIYGGREREENDCGKIQLWSWAASRVMDYCQTLDCLDFEKAAVIGHSRLGKTALVTGMMDERFQYVISNDSGGNGAAISRGKIGEPAATWMPYWYAPAYWKYQGKEYDMPFDQHFLVAASAPRHVYVASAEEDSWADPDSEYLSCCAASEVYERLGMKGFVHPDRLPVPTDVFHEGNIGYHLRYGSHYLGREDWNYYCAYIRNC